MKLRRHASITASSMSNLLQSAVALASELVDFVVQSSNHFQRFVDRRTELVAITLPAIDAFDLGSPAAHLGVDLLAELALGSCRNRLHDEFHATRFTDSVLLGTVLAKVTPLPVAASKSMLVVEAHVSSGRAGLFRAYLSLVLSYGCLVDNACRLTWRLDVRTIGPDSWTAGLLDGSAQGL